MKKAISTLLMIVLFWGLLFSTNNASAEESPVFRLYPLTANNNIYEKAVRFGSLDFGDQASYIDKEGKEKIHTHNGVDIMVQKVSKDNVVYVYPFKDSEAYVVRNNTLPQYTTKVYTTAYDTYWNSFLIVYYPSLKLYVYYGHIVSKLAPKSKIDTKEPLGTIRESFGLGDERTTDNDHLHLSVSDRTDVVDNGWGYSEGALLENDVRNQGWLDPIEFMRGNGETLQKYLDEQTNNASPNTESTAIVPTGNSRPSFLQSIGNFFKSIQNGISGFWNSIVKIAFGAENGNQISFASASNATTGNATAGNATAGNATAGNSAVAEATQVPNADGIGETLENGTYFLDFQGSVDYDTSPAQGGRVIAVDGGYVVTCDILDAAKIDYDEYNLLLEGKTITKKFGVETCELKWVDTYEEALEFEAIIDGQVGYLKLFSVSTPSTPALLCFEHPGEGWMYRTGKTVELFISGETVVTSPFGDFEDKSFDDYLETGCSDDYDGWYANYYYAEVVDGEIIKLETSYSA